MAGAPLQNSASPSQAVVASSIQTKPASTVNPKLDELTALFTKLELTEYLPAFAKEDIFIGVLKTMTDDDLKQFIPKVSFIFIRYELTRCLICSFDVTFAHSSCSICHFDLFSPFLQ